MAKDVKEILGLKGKKGKGPGGSFKRIKAWVKKHPVIAGAIVLVVVAAALLLRKNKDSQTTLASSAGDPSLSEEDGLGAIAEGDLEIPEEEPFPPLDPLPPLDLPPLEELPPFPFDDLGDIPLGSLGAPLAGGTVEDIFDDPSDFRLRFKRKNNPGLKVRGTSKGADTKSAYRGLFPSTAKRSIGIKSQRQKAVTTIGLKAKRNQLIGTLISAGVGSSSVGQAGLLAARLAAQAARAISLRNRQKQQQRLKSRRRTTYRRPAPKPAYRPPPKKQSIPASYLAQKKKILQYNAKVKALKKKQSTASSQVVIL